MSALGSHLKAARIGQCLSLRDVERRSAGKVSNAYLSQIENGAVENPSLAIIWSISKALGLDFAETAAIAVGEFIPEPKICPTCGQPI